MEESEQDGKEKNSDQRAVEMERLPKTREADQAEDSDEYQETEDAVEDAKGEAAQKQSEAAEEKGGEDAGQGSVEADKEVAEEEQEALSANTLKEEDVESQWRLRGAWPAGHPPPGAPQFRPTQSAPAKGKGNEDDVMHEAEGRGEDADECPREEQGENKGEREDARTQWRRVWVDRMLEDIRYPAGRPNKQQSEAEESSEEGNEEEPSKEQSKAAEDNGGEDAEEGSEKEGNEEEPSKEHTEAADEKGGGEDGEDRPGVEKEPSVSVSEVSGLLSPPVLSSPTTPKNTSSSSSSSSTSSSSGGSASPSNKPKGKPKGKPKAKPKGKPKGKDQGNPEPEPERKSKKRSKGQEPEDRRLKQAAVKADIIAQLDCLPLYFQWTQDEQSDIGVQEALCTLPVTKSIGKAPPRNLALRKMLEKRNKLKNCRKPLRKEDGLETKEAPEDARPRKRMRSKGPDSGYLGVKTISCL